jgi:hypothetical protein
LWDVKERPFVKKKNKKINKNKGERDLDLRYVVI